MMRAFRLAPVVFLAVALSACATKVQVSTEVEMPLLDPPPPPPRVVATYPEELEPAPLAVPVSQEPARVPSRPVRTDLKPETAPAEQTVPLAERPSLTLSPAPGTEGQTEASIRALLTKASRDLSRANPATLSADGRAQFETARRFLQQAEDALKSRNFVYAGTLADKAATLAAVFAR
jgi:hypothetical protein